MDEVTFNVKQNVAVVTVLDLQDIAYQAVSGQTVAKVVLGFLVSV